MATLLPNARVAHDRLRGYRIFVFSHDHPHPAHVHFGKSKRFSGWDILSVECTDRDGFSSADLALQRELLVQYQQEILESWHEHWHRQYRL